MKSILFVDDETRILDGLKRMLHSNRDRWEMQFAANGEDGLRACGEKDFDVVISDMRMPGMDGVTFLRHVRDRLPNAARIILTGYSETSLAVRSVSVAHRTLAKPCNPSELQDLIERIIALEDLVSPPEIRRIVGAVGELPALSKTYTCLTKAVANPDVSLIQISRIIEQDIALSAKILQLTNSAFFGLPQPITSIAGAVSFLGIETIKNLALASEAFSAFKPAQHIPRNFCEHVQTHAMSVASIASRLPLYPASRDTIVIAALLHDIGELFLASKMPEEFSKVLTRQAAIGGNRYQIEEELLGTSHAEIGAYLLGLWGIPKPVVEAVAHHHNLHRVQSSTLQQAAAVHIADLLARDMEMKPLNPTTQNEVRNRECLDALGLLQRMDEFRAICSDEVLSS